jgi:hypothetical protein
MSTPLDPKHAFRFALPDDPAKAIVCRRGTCREWDTFDSEVEAACSIPESHKFRARLYALLDGVTVAKEGFDAFDELHPEDLMDICQSLSEAAAVTGMQRKKSERQSRSKPGESAANASKAAV